MSNAVCLDVYLTTQPNVAINMAQLAANLVATVQIGTLIYAGANPERVIQITNQTVLSIFDGAVISATEAAQDFSNA